MADYSIHATTELSHRLSSLSTFLPAVEQLRRLLIPYLSAQPQNVLSLIETAKATLQRSGIKLHKFADCPTYLRQHKDAYFALLDDLQTCARQHPLESSHRELQVQLSRLLFPLTTQMNIATASIWSSRQVQARRSNSSTDTQLSTPRASHLPSSAHCPPPNAMPPPPDPISWHSKHGPSSTYMKSFNSVSNSLSSRDCLKASTRRARTAASVRRLSRQNSVTRFDESPSSSQSDDSDDDTTYEDDEVDKYRTPVVITRPQRMRRSFGIFCTGKNKTFTTGGHQRHRL